ncbi:hypothetical protein AGR1B_Cc110130 [Agrobacterium fabacearum S56]|nr:hypothetical protein AGR1B_Cc110130 [Agrobacterium fabacearum S56]
MAKFPRELDSARKQDIDAIRPRELVKRAIYRAVDSDTLGARNRLTAPLDVYCAQARDAGRIGSHGRRLTSIRENGLSAAVDRG